MTRTHVPAKSASIDDSHDDRKTIVAAHNHTIRNISANRISENSQRGRAAVFAESQQNALQEIGLTNSELQLQTSSTTCEVEALHNLACM